VHASADMATSIRIFTFFIAVVFLMVGFCVGFY
jgi:hypothetical protein